MRGSLAGIRAVSQDQASNLVINLGPPFPKEFECFWSNLLEPVNYTLEKPTGPGIAPLGMLCSVAFAICSWLSASPTNIVVSTDHVGN